MNKYYLTIIIVLFLIGKQLAQPNIKIEPRNIKFEDIFSRYDYTFIYNEGNLPLIIDSMSATSPFYVLDFEGNTPLPLVINPGDTIKLNAILTNFYSITVHDTTDTVWVYSNDPESPRDLRIKIDFFDDDYGSCNGLITDSQILPLPNANVYFFYYGVYLFDSTSTDANGVYSSQLPKGNYTVAASKDGYRTMFSGNTPDPFYAQSVELDSGQTLNINLMLPTVSNTGFSVSGIVIDSIYGTPIDKGVVVIRKGTHTPTLLKSNGLAVDSIAYAGFINSDGSYNIPVEDSTYYFIQGYTGYYLPTYFNNQNYSSVFWQNADSLLVDQQLTNKNLYLQRDSSYGGGGAYGYITLPPSESYDYNGITILAKSLTNDKLYSYNFSKDDGNFYLNNLPYGDYKLIAQKVGLPNALSNEFTISPQNQNQNNINIRFTLTDVEEEDNIIPTSIKLYNNYPNPFNPSTKIKYAISNVTTSGVGVSRVILKVYDILGNEVAKLVDEERSAGTYEVTFNGNGLASGVYVATLRVNSIRISQKIVLMK